MLTGEVPMGHFELPSKKVEVDVRLDEVVLRALAREPQRRYQTANEVRTDVNSIIATAGARPSGEPIQKALPFAKPDWLTWQIYAAYSLVMALMLHALLAAIYGGDEFWNKTVVATACLTIVATSTLAYLIEKLKFDARRSAWRGRNFLAMVLGLMLLLIPVILLSPVELKDWVPSSAASLTPRDERYLRLLQLGLWFWSIYFVAAQIFYPLGRSIRQGRRSQNPREAPDVDPSGTTKGQGAASLVVNPAWGLIITGIISWITIPLAFMIPFMQPDLVGAQRTIFQISFGVIPLVVGTIMALAGFRMKRLEGYRLAMCAAVLPIVVLIFKLIGLSFGTLAIGPADLVGAPVGLWALVILTRSDVQAAFHTRELPEAS
jgi:hypothetical protein